MKGRAAQIVLAAVLGTILAAILACGPKTGGSPEEAKAMLDKAVAHYEAVGREEAMNDFNRSGEFRDRELYVFCLNERHLIIANGAFRNIVGTNGDDVKDAYGNSLADAMFNAVRGTGEATVEYPWTNPVTKQVEPKVSFVKKLGTDVCGVGAYKSGKAKGAS